MDLGEGAGGAHPSLRWPAAFYLIELVFCKKYIYLAPVVRKVDNAIHWINHYPVDSLVWWIAIYPVDSIMQSLNNWDLDQVVQRPIS